MLYKNAHDRTIFIFLNSIIVLKIECANLDAAPIRRFEYIIYYLNITIYILNNM